MGLSDHPALAASLPTRFDYTNSYYHRFPRLDLLNVTDDQREMFNFVSCSDVLEHVPPPADAALAGLHTLLRPGGFAVVSVPVGEAETSEYYPDLATWQSTETEVRWTDMQGREHIDTDPEWHGGPGQTLAFRTWGATDFETRLHSAGFREVFTPPEQPGLGVPFLSGGGVWIARRE